MTTTQETNSISIPADRYGRVSGAEVAKLFSRMTNSTMKEDAAVSFRDEVISEHRTLQQSMMAAMLTTIVGIADRADEFGFDDRNAEAVRIARQIRDTVVQDRLFRSDNQVLLPTI